jgi:RNA polymerase sigma-70 factor (ECF subfamily)
MSQRDRDIIHRILNGQPSAFAELVDAHKDKAMTLAMRILKNRADAEEALQDAFIRVFKSLQNFKGEANFSTWFYRIVYNVCLTALRKRGEHFLVKLDDEAFKSEIAADEINPLEMLESEELQRLLDVEIKRLPANYGAIFTLFYVQELSYDDICSVTGMPLGTVKTQLHRARLLLKKNIEKHFTSGIVAQENLLKGQKL